MKYSKLADINRENVAQLAPAWSWATGDAPILKSDTTEVARPGTFQATPLMLNDTLYLPTPLNRAIADQEAFNATYVATTYFDGASVKKLDPSLETVVPPSATIVIVVGDDFAQSLVQ